MLNKTLIIMLILFHMMLEWENIIKIINQLQKTIYKMKIKVKKLKKCHRINVRKYLIENMIVK